MNARTIGTALAVAAATAGMLTAFRRGFGAGLAAGYQYGHIDGDRKGYKRCVDNARLDAVLAAPTEAQHYAGIVSQLPDACDSAAFAEVLLNGGLREGLHEGVFPWEAS